MIDLLEMGGREFMANDRTPDRSARLNDFSERRARSRASVERGVYNLRVRREFGAAGTSGGVDRRNFCRCRSALFRPDGSSHLGK
jgi:hypothetical protein